MLASIPLVLGFFGDAASGFRFAGAFPRPSGGLCSLSAGLCCWRRCYWKQACWRRPRPGRIVDDAFGACLSRPGQRGRRRPKPASARSIVCCSSICVFDNPAPEKVLSLIGRVQPDVITLNEVSGDVGRELQLISAMYPYSVVCDAPSGSAAWRSCRVGRCRRQRPADASTAEPWRPRPIDFGGRRVEVAALHLHGRGRSSSQARSTALRHPLGRLGRNGDLAGDLNAAPWSAACGAIEAAGGLDPGRRHRADLALPPAARACALCRPADRPGLRQGRYRDRARRKRSKPSAPTICRCWSNSRCSAAQAEENAETATAFD